MSTTRPRSISAKETIAVTLHVALEHHHRSELQEASALYREILGMDPDHADSLFLLGMIAIADGDREAAVQLLRAAVRNRPKAAHMHSALAEALLGAERISAALQSYWRILSLEPGNPLAYVQVGDVLRLIKPKGGNDVLAASCYRRALDIDAVCAQAHFGLGNTYWQAGDLAGAEREYRAALASEERTSSFHGALADVLYAGQQYSPAADAYRRAIQLKPNSPTMLRRLGDALLHLGQHARAEACHLRANALLCRTARSSESRTVLPAALTNLRPWKDRTHESHGPGRAAMLSPHLPARSSATDAFVAEDEIERTA